MPQPPAPRPVDQHHKPTRFILEFIAKFRVFDEYLAAAPGAILTKCTADFPFPGRFDPDAFLELWGNDGDEFTKQSARFVVAVYRGANDLDVSREDSGFYAFDFIEWTQRAPVGVRVAVALWLAEPFVAFP